jgi:hypothetical protein
MWKPRITFVGSLSIGIGRLLGLIGAFAVIVGVCLMLSSGGDAPNGATGFGVGGFLLAVAVGLHMLAGKTAKWFWLR